MQQPASSAGDRLPVFEEVIKIEVEVNSVYLKMLDTLPEGYKHRKILAHAIVGGAIESGNIAYVFNALNGYTNEIDFEIGNEVICKEIGRYEQYDANKQNEKGEPTVAWDPKWDEPDYKPSWKYREVEIGQCSVKKINLYTSDKLEVEFESWDKYSHKQIVSSKRVSHKKCNKVHAVRS